MLKILTSYGAGVARAILQTQAGRLTKDLAQETEIGFRSQISTQKKNNGAPLIPLFGFECPVLLNHKILSAFREHPKLTVQPRIIVIL